MDDRMLLEAAARAAGIDGVYCEFMNAIQRLPGHETPYGEAHSFWNALEDDGAALRLAVKLNIDVFGGIDARMCETDIGTTSEPDGDDPYAAQRRAIVRAAAALQESRDV